MQRPLIARAALGASALAVLSLGARAQLTVTPTTVAADLADALFDSAGIGCMTPLAGLQAHVSGAAKSSGTFVEGGLFGYGIKAPAGIVLSTGDVANYSSGANTVVLDSLAYGVVATVPQDTLLDSIQGVGASTWNDVTQLDLTFVAPATWTGRMHFDVVFATNEYVPQVRKDAFGLFHNGVNVALWMGDGVHAQHQATALFAETEADAAIERLPGLKPASAVMHFKTPPIAPSTANTFTFIVGDQTNANIDSTVYISMRVEDCNGNSIADYCDVVAATSFDVNDDGVPDECEPLSIEVERYCVCDANPIAGPCANNVPIGIVAGCVNSTGAGGQLDVSGGLGACPAAISFDVTNVRPNGVGILITAAQPHANAPAFYDGRMCLRAPIKRFGIVLSDFFGSVSVPLTPTATGGSFNCGETHHFQYWYRDPSGPCMKLSNLTNAVKVTF